MEPLIITATPNVCRLDPEAAHSRTARKIA